MKIQIELSNRKKIIIGVSASILVVAAISAFFFFRPSKQAEAAWFDMDWIYRQAFSFTHNAAITSERRITFSLDTAELIAANAMQADCDDVRFTDINGKLLKYELTGVCDNAATTYEVVFPSIINGLNPGYVYYGNPAAGSKSQDVSAVTELTPSAGDPAITDRTSEEIGPGPIAYWKFDEGTNDTCSGGINDVCDSTENANDGAITGATWQTEDMCVSGKCLGFDGVDDYVTVADQQSQHFDNNFTVETWIKINHFPITDEAFPINKYGEYYLIIHMDGKLGYLLDNTSPGWVIQKTTYDLPLNQWIHVAFTYDDSYLIKMYVDGNQVYSYSGSGDIADNDGSLLIGRLAGLISEEPFDGFIDEPKIYPYARTEAQIKADYLARGSVLGASASMGGGDMSFLSDGLVGYWKMDEASWSGAVDEVIDYSGNGNHGQAAGDTVPSTAIGKFGKSGEFDGSYQYVTVDVSDMGLGASQTITAWVRPDGQVDDNPHQVVACTDLTYEQGVHLMTYRHASGVFMIIENIPFGEVPQANVDVNDGNWHFVAGTYDYNSGNAYIFVDGVAYGPTYVGQYNITVDGPGRIARGYHGTDYAYDGSIDGLRFYNRALSPQELAGIYNWAPGPVGYWKMDEGVSGDAQTIYDTSGNSNNATTVDGANNTGMNCQVSGKYGKGCEFDGADDYINAGTSSSLNITRDITIGAWIYPKGWGENNLGRIVSKGTVEGYNFLITSTNSTLQLQARGQTNNTINGNNNIIVLNNWQHVSVAYNSTTSTASFYVNGIYSGGGILDNFLSSAAIPLLVGAYTTSTRFFDGYIDDLKIYNYARTQKQIIEDMNAGHPSVGTPVGSALAHYKFDEGYGAVVYDAGFNGDNGDLVDGPSWTSSGKFGKALSFDGLNDRVQGFTSDPFEYRGGSLTLSAWVKRDVGERYGDIISKPWNGGGQYNYILSLNNYVVNLSLYGDSSWNVSTTETIPEETWTHVLATVDSDSNVKIYINGRLSKNDNHTITGWSPSDGNISPCIGSLYPYSAGWAGNTTSSFDGFIDEVKIYNFALTADQVMVEYNQGAAQVLGSASSSGNAPITHCKFDENQGQNAYDSINNNPGTLGASDGVGADDPTWAAAKYGSGLGFDGGDHVRAEDSASLDGITSAITLEAWVYRLSTGAQEVVMKGWDNDVHFRLEISSGDDTSFGYYDGATYHRFSNTNDNLTTGVWYHLAAVYEFGSADSAKIYVNGIQNTSSSWASGDGTGSASPNNYRLIIGARNDGAYGNFVGGIDDVRIYDYARTQAQIIEDMNGGRPAYATPLGWWKLDECSGTIAYDSGLGANNGTLIIGATSDNAEAGTCASGDTTDAWYNGVNGKRNHSLDFDGADDYVYIGNPSELLFTTQSFSITAWYKPDNVAGGYNVIVGRYQTGGWQFSIHKPNNSKKLKVTRYTGSYISSESSEDVFENDEWSFIACVYDRSDNTLKCYDNGIQLTMTNSAGVGDIGSNGYYSIGANHDPWAGGNWADGQIDEVRIYNYALSESEIKLIYNEGAVYFGPSEGSP